MTWCCLAAHGDSVCLWMVLTPAIHIATGMGKHAGRRAASCAWWVSRQRPGSSAGDFGTDTSFVVDFPGVQLEHRERGFQLHSQTPQCHRGEQAGDTLVHFSMSLPVVHKSAVRLRHKDPTTDQLATVTPLNKQSRTQASPVMVAITVPQVKGSICQAAGTNHSSFGPSTATNP